MDNNQEISPENIMESENCEVGSPTSQDHQPEEVEGNKHDEPRIVQAELTGDRFEINNRGVFWLVGDAKEALCGPVRIFCNARGLDNRNWTRIVLVRDKDGNSHQLSIPMADLDGDGLIRKLRECGVTVVNRQKTKDRLILFFQECPPEDASAFRLTKKTGWHGNSYVLGNGETIGCDAERFIYDDVKVKDPAAETAGTIEEWQQHMARYCKGNSRLMFAASAAFAAPLLHVLGAEGGGFNFVGNSSTGKSTAVMLAASVYGLPSKNVQGWRATANGLELLALKHNDAMLAMDEIGEMNPKEIGEAAYMLANGQGKQRMKASAELRERLTWRTLILSSGELTLADHMSEGGKRVRAGQEVRLADIPADAGAGYGLFENLHGFANGAEFSVQLKQNAERYHGVALRLFLKHVVESPETVKASHQKVATLFRARYIPQGSSSQVCRLAERMILVATAGEFATECGLTGWENGEAIAAAGRCFESWIESRGGTDRQEEIQIVNHIRRFIEMHGESRFALVLERDGQLILADDLRTIPNKAGFRRRSGDGMEYLVQKEVFNGELCAGFNRKTVVEVLAKRGILHVASDGRSQLTRRLPNIGPTKVYVLTPLVVADGEEEIPVVESEANDSVE